MLTVGHLARTYGQLPSAILANATTYDIAVDDLYQRWETEERTGHKDTPNLSEDEIMKIWSQHKKS